MKPISVHDLMVHSVVIVGCCLIVLVMQIVIITKSTIPADAVITEIRVFRGDVTTHHEEIVKKLTAVDRTLDLEITRKNTIKAIEASDANIQ